jgi:pimeloyl-ACP methyl ester carboxylesterase
MTAPLGFIIALTLMGGQPRMMAKGGDPARGLLVNRTLGQRPFDPISPSKPTIVFIHGSNAVPGVMRFAMAQHLGEAIGRKYGNAFNVVEWDWNASATFRLTLQEMNDEAIRQGQMLANALASQGIQPHQMHLIGQSAGSTVASSAARTMSKRTGLRVMQITLLDAAATTHEVVFHELQPFHYANTVENYWTHGLSAFGRPAETQGVRDIEIEHTTPLSGLVIPERSGHLSIVRWYVNSVESIGEPNGFNTSGLLAR